MRVMGLDVGDKYIGVAISDELGLTAHGLKTIKREGCIEVLKENIKEYEVGSIIVGVPRMLNGSLGIQGEKVLKFVEDLKASLGLPTFLWDERLSTLAAERTLLEADTSRKKRRTLRDKVSAVIILQGYLDSINR